MIDLNNPDKSNWLKGHCDVPFKTILIDENGNIFLCGCQAYLPKILCNILDIDNRDDFWNIFYNNEIRNSILDKTHKFCSLKCSAIQSAIHGKITNNFVSYENLINTKPLNLQLCIDNSCNLKCPTCRTEMIIHKNNYFYQDRLKKILEKIDMIFFKPTKIYYIHLLSGGEFLASTPITNWMTEKVNENINFKLQTNGTLLFKNKEKCNLIFKKTESLFVSIDAACKETYEITRLNGNWDSLIQSLEYLKKYFPKINKTFNFTVSSLNYKDINKFINFCEIYNPNEIYFSRVENWFDDRSYFIPLDIFNPKHENYNDFLKIIKETNFDQHHIRTNFYDFLINVS